MIVKAYRIWGLSARAKLMQLLKSASAHLTNKSELRPFVKVEPTTTQQLYWDSVGTLTYTITSNANWEITL